MSVVDVKLGSRGYRIEIGSGNLATLGTRVGQWCRLSHAVVITDANVERPHATTAALARRER